MAEDTGAPPLLMLALSPFLSRFGGGPAVNHLYVCSICQVEIEALAKRRRVEIDTFIKVLVGNRDLGTMCCQALRSAVLSGGGQRLIAFCWQRRCCGQVGKCCQCALLCVTGVLLSLGTETLLAEDCWALHPPVEGA